VRTVANSAAHIAEYPRPGVACSTSDADPERSLSTSPAGVASGRVLGIEPVLEALAQACAHAACIDNVEFALGDVYALDHPDGDLDVVHAHQVLQHLNDPGRALREMLRVCRPVGVVAAQDADYAAMTCEVPELGTRS